MYIVFLTPIVITFLTVYLYPAIRTFIMSAYKIPGLATPSSQWEFVGLGNFKELFGRHLFKVACKNMFLILVVAGIVVFLISMFFSWVLHRGMRLGAFWCNMIYLPCIITPVAMVVVWTQYAFNNRFGLLKSIFDALGMEKAANIPWTSPQFAFWAMMIAFCFGCIGGNLTVYMAAMKKIPGELYEAAFADGATEGIVFFKITMPLIRDNIKTQITFWCLGSIGFFLWSRVFSVVPSDPNTITPASYMYDLIFGTSASANAMVSDPNVGLGTSVGVLLCLASIVVFGVINLVFRGDKYEF